MSLSWFTGPDELDATTITAFNNIVSETRVDSGYHVYDADGSSGRDQLKGCHSGTVVMTGDGSEFGTATNQTWQGPYAVDSFDGLFTLGIYGGHADDGGSNYSLPQYWYLR